MKKIYVLLLSFLCLCSLNAFAESPCDNEIKMQPKTNCMQPCPKQQTQCPQTYEQPYSACFLCTQKNMDELFSQLCLSNVQICTAQKIQDKYNLEVYSLNDRIQCEEENLCQLKEQCASNSEIRKQKRLINNLKRERNKICKCYEYQFKTILSDKQKRNYNKYKKCK